jgi:hypothetical protein
MEGGYGSQAIFPVNERGPGVAIGAFDEHGRPAHVVYESGPGVPMVFFPEGLPTHLTSQFPPELAQRLSSTALVSMNRRANLLLLQDS